MSQLATHASASPPPRKRSSAASGAVDELEDDGVHEHGDERGGVELRPGGIEEDLHALAPQRLEALGVSAPQGARAVVGGFGAESGSDLLVPALDPAFREGEAQPLGRILEPEERAEAVDGHGVEAPRRQRKASG